MDAKLVKILLIVTHVLNNTCYQQIKLHASLKYILVLLAIVFIVKVQEYVLNVLQVILFQLFLKIMLE